MNIDKEVKSRSVRASSLPPDLTSQRPVLTSQKSCCYFSTTPTAATATPRVNRVKPVVQQEYRRNGRIETGGSRDWLEQSEMSLDTRSQVTTDADTLRG